MERCSWRTKLHRQRCAAWKACAALGSSPFSVRKMRITSSSAAAGAAAFFLPSGSPCLDGRREPLRPWQGKPPGKLFCRDGTRPADVSGKVQQRNNCVYMFCNSTVSYDPAPLPLLRPRKMHHIGELIEYFENCNRDKMSSPQPCTKKVYAAFSKLFCGCFNNRAV